MPSGKRPRKTRDHRGLVCPKCGTRITITKRAGLKSAKCPGKGCTQRIKIPKR